MNFSFLSRKWPLQTAAPLSSPNMLQLPVRYFQFHLTLTGIAPSQSKCEFSGKLFLLQRSKDFRRSIPLQKGAIKCFSEPKEREKETEAINKDGHDVISDDVSVGEIVRQEFSDGSVGSVRSSIPNSASGDSLNLGIREPVYEVSVLEILGVLIHHCG